MNVLSLFDGMSCGQLALQKAGIKVSSYYASEIDKYAIKVSSENFPNTIHLGGVQGVATGDHFPSIDLLIGGSPCQGFSFAGKQLNFDDPRSKLFFEYVRILKKIKPKWFLLENVVMKKEYQDVITKELGVEPIMINSALLSAQNRRRLYWTNIPFKKEIQDAGIFLKDILEDAICDRDKSYCIDASYFKGGNYKQYTEKKRRQLVIQINPDKSCGGKQPSLQDRVYDKSGKSPALTSSHAGRTNVGIYQRPRGFNKGGLHQEKSPSMSSSSWEQNNLLVDESMKWRKLTVLECKRLQTVPDDYKMNVSNSQAYKMLGNGWTVDVIAHIFKGMED